jgi:hypothetical protein
MNAQEKAYKALRAALGLTVYQDAAEREADALEEYCVLRPYPTIGRQFADGGAQIETAYIRVEFKKCTEVKKKLWGGRLWSDGYFVNTAGRHSAEKQIEQYVKNQGKAHAKLCGEQTPLLRRGETIPRLLGRGGFIEHRTTIGALRRGFVPARKV